MTTVGYGDIRPESTVEVLFGMICMLVAAGMFANLINIIGRIFSNFNIVHAEYSEHV